MNLLTLLDMARSAMPNRVAIGTKADGLTFAGLYDAAVSGGREIVRSGARNLVFIGVNGSAWPVSLYAAAAAGVPVVSLNYRLSQTALAALLGRIEAPFVVADAAYLGSLKLTASADAVESGEWLAWLARGAGVEDEAGQVGDETQRPAVILFTSGTTSEPKGVLLRHENLTSYVIETVEFGAAAVDDAALVSVPPYHVAGVGTVLTNGYAGRRLVYLPNFSPRGWLDLVRDEGITQVMVVPTMLARILDELGGAPADLPRLRSIAYGGAPMPETVLRRALRAFPQAGFVNSYGLTETSSTIAILGPDDHRAALTRDDPAVAARLASVGRPVPGIEVIIRGEDGRPLAPGVAGQVWVRGAQVSAEYLGQTRAVDADGWFYTRDRAYLDADGYLFLQGRADDTIIRGGENIAPAEIESALRLHPNVADVAVVGAPDEEWGQRIVAVIVPKPGAEIEPGQVRAWARQRLRGSRTPDDVLVVPQLPYNPMGKLLRREVEQMITVPTTHEEER